MNSRFVVAIAAIMAGCVANAAPLCCGAFAGERVDVRPHQFTPGGWSLDVQFMDVMGSPYLIAHGKGIRVADAVANVEIPKSGAWRVWVRSRKWVDGAGFFAVQRRRSRPCRRRRRFAGDMRGGRGGEARHPIVRELRGWFMNRDANMALYAARCGKL